MDVEHMESAILAFHHAMERAEQLAKAQEFGDPLTELLRHAREMLDIVDEELERHRGHVRYPQFHELSTAMRAKVAEAQSLLAPTTH